MPEESTTQNRLARLQEAYASYSTSGLDWDLMTDDIEFRQPDEIGGGQGVYIGREGVARGVQELLDVFDELHSVPERFFTAGDYVVVYVRLRGRAKGSGVPIDAPYAHVWRFRGEQVDLWHAYSDRQAALKAVGLEE
jgi:ketosteroid isomerase-like protein